MSHDPSAGVLVHRTWSLAAAVLLVGGILSVHAWRTSPADEPTTSATRPVTSFASVAATADPPLDVEIERLVDPARSSVTADDGRWLATFTDGARTVALAGPRRTFGEPSAQHDVTTDVWVRVLEEPFDGEVDLHWLAAALEDEEPDVLAVATEYFADAPESREADGALVSAPADYGPLQPDGTRPVGADWHDFLGVDATYGHRVDPADPEEYRALDCSGYVRTVFGFRHGIPMSLRPDGGHSLPRRSFEQAAEAPGIVPIPDGEVDEEALQPGDLVFFDAASDDDGRIDHVGIYVGMDDGGHHRFLHSRRSSNGPTIGGDDNGPSILDGDGHFARGFQSTRRL